MALRCIRRSAPFAAIRCSRPATNNSTDTEEKIQWHGDFTERKVEPTKLNAFRTRTEMHVKGCLVVGVHVCRAILVARARTIHGIYVQATNDQFPKRVQKTVLPLVEHNRYSSLVHPMEAWAIEKGLSRHKMGDVVHQGIVMDVSPFKVRPMKLEKLKFDSIGRNESGRSQVWLLVENMSNRGDFGSILRSALYLGVSRIILPHMSDDKTQRFTSGVVSKASAGALELMKIYQLPEDATVQTFLEAAAGKFRILYAPNKFDSSDSPSHGASDTPSNTESHSTSCASSDTGSDAGLDASLDSVSRAASDAGSDASSDSRTVSDAGSDASSDAASNAAPAMPPRTALSDLAAESARPDLVVIQDRGLRRATALLCDAVISLPPRRYSLGSTGPASDSQPLPLEINLSFPCEIATILSRLTRAKR